MQTPELFSQNPEQRPTIQPTEVYLHQANKDLHSYEYVQNINEASREATSTAESIDDFDSGFRVKITPEYGQKLSIEQVTPWMGGVALNRYRKAELNADTTPVDVSDLIAQQLRSARPAVDQTKTRDNYGLGA
jgi:hypothetical protein